MFLHYILKENCESLLKRFFLAQLANPTRNDWCQAVQETLDYLELKFNFDQIKLMKTENLKEIVKNAIRKKAIEYLNAKKADHSKVRDLAHTKWEMQPYLKPNDIQTQEAKFIFQLRTRMVDVRQNYGNRYSETICPNCKAAPDDQPHLLECPLLADISTVATSSTKYESLFSSDLEEVVNVSRILNTSFRKRNQLLKSKK